MGNLFSKAKEIKSDIKEDVPVTEDKPGTEKSDVVIELTSLPNGNQGPTEHTPNGVTNAEPHKHSPPTPKGSLNELDKNNSGSNNNQLQITPDANAGDTTNVDVDPKAQNAIQKLWANPTARKTTYGVGAGVVVLLILFLLLRYKKKSKKSADALIEPSDEELTV